MEVEGDNVVSARASTLAAVDDSAEDGDVTPDHFQDAMARRVEAEDKIRAPCSASNSAGGDVDAWMEVDAIRLGYAPAWVLPRQFSITVRQRIRVC